MSTNKSIDAGNFLVYLEEPASSEKWLYDLQSNALKSLREGGFPTRKVEEWKYTDVEPIVSKEYAKVSEASEVAFTPLSETYSIVFVDGVFSEKLSDIDRLPSGLTVKQFTEASAENSEVMKKALTDGPNDCVSAFTQLNAAFANAGVYIEVAKNTAVDKPVHVVNILSAENRISVLRNVVNLNEGAELELMENFVSDSESQAFSNVVTDVFLSKNATLRHVKNQSQNESSFHIGSIRVSQDRDSNYYSSVFTCGSAISRLDLDTELNDENASCDLKGLYAVKGSQLADNHTFMNHNAPRTFSDQIYKGILDERSRGVYNGKVFIARDSQLVESSQLNKNLMLSKNARIDTKPELDVYADDVKAAHGAAIGQLNEDELFYIQSRCISKDDAMAMLVHGHMEEVIETVKSPQIREYLEEIYLDIFTQK